MTQAAVLRRRSLPGMIANVFIGIGVVMTVWLVVSVPLDLRAQWAFAISTIVGAVLIGRNRSRRSSLVIAVLSTIVSTRYMFWRTTETLSFNSLPEALLGTGLYLAEVYAWLILVLGFFQTSWPLDRPPVEIEGAPEEWPTIDVYIPTYNESLEIVRNTVYAAMDMDYPADRFRVFILDDGRRPEFRAFARSVKCGYLTRADNLHAKAGNLNAAMKQTDGSLIAIFDCDHVPTRAFLQFTAGWFQKDAQLALLQTPHHFYTPDPVQRNLEGAEDMPGEGDLFYGAVQNGNDLWNATFFCGSCAIIRRTALEQTNGFAGETVTEDAHTALKLQRMGWNTAYIGARLSAGLATERLVLHIGQRIRWARGMTQIMRIDNPLFGPGLSWQQRLCYANAMLHFQFPLPRIVFLTSPLAYLIAGANIIHASAGLIFAYAFPHLFLSMQSSDRTQGGDRRPFWGEIYETLLAFHLVKPTIYTLFNPRKGKFNVTDKGGLLSKTYFDLHTVRPHLITIGLMMFGIAFAFGKSFFPDMFDVHLDTLLLNTVWATFSLIILIAAVSVAREQRQVRNHIRIPVELPITLYFDDGYVIEGKTRDISMGGLSAKIDDDFNIRGRVVTHISMPMGDDTFAVPVDTIKMQQSVANVSFKPLGVEQIRLLIRSVMGRADAWQPERPHPSVSPLRSVKDIVGIDAVTLGAIVTAWRQRRKDRKLAARNPLAAAAAGSSIIKAVAILGAILGSFLLLPTMGHSQPARAAPAAAAADAATPAPLSGLRQRTTLRDLQVKYPIRLAGTRGEYGIPFGMRPDQVVTQATLTLNMAYSPALLADVSQLVVVLNGEVVQTVRLEQGGADRTTLAIPINPALFLAGENQLNLRFIGHYARDCEDPFHSSLWANISNTRSFLDTVVERVPVGPNLARLPAPFFDRAMTTSLVLPFVFAGAPSNGELEAAGSLASWFGGLASYRGFSFPTSVGTFPRGNAIVFVTNQRRIGTFGGSISGPSVAVVANPSDPNGTLMLVMGRDEHDLKLAAAAISLNRGLLGGTLASLASARIPTMPRYSAPRWLRTDRPIQLGEIVDPRSLQGLGLPPGPLTAAFRVAPDLFFWPHQGATMNVRYRYPAASWLDTRASRLDVSLNNQYLRTLPLSGQSMWSIYFDRYFGKGEGADTRTSRASMTLPSYILFGQNQLVFDYNLILANKKRCEGTVPDNVRVAILPDSTIDLSSSHHAIRLPNLATFASAGYPFTIRPDLGETAVVLGANPALSTIQAYLELLGRLGDSTGSPATQVTVMHQFDRQRADGKHILLIGGTDLAGSGDLFADAPVRFQTGKLQVAERNFIERAFDFVSPDQHDSPKSVGDYIYNTNSFTGIISFESPFDRGRSVVAVLADDPTNLPTMIAGLADVKMNAQVQGDISVSTGDGMTSFAVGDSYWSGSLPLWMKIAYWLSGRPLLLALGGVLAALLIAAPIYHMLKRQERKRLRALEK